LTAKDVIAPTFSCPSAQDAALDINCQITVPDLLTGITDEADNCGTATMSQNPTAGTLITLAHKATTSVLITANDGNGNTKTCSVTLTAKDVIAPTFSCPSAQDAALDINCQITVPDLLTGITDEADNCGTATMSQNPTAGTLITLAHNATTSVLITANDGNGNTKTCSVTLTAKDVIAPTFSCPSAQDAALDINCQITVPDVLTGITDEADNCGTATMSQNPTAGTLITLAHNATTSVLITANDGNGNTKTCSVTLTAKDVIAPTFSCPSAQDAALDINCQITVPDLITGITDEADNCGTATMSQNPTAGTLITLAHNATTSVLITANDGNGNTKTCSVTLTAKDVITPTITSIGDKTRCATTTATSYTTIGTEFDPVTYSDNCGTPTITNNITATNTLAAHIFTAGITPVVWTVNDGNGNTNSFTMNITVNAKQSIGGNLNYYNTANTPLTSGIAVKLWENGIQIGSDYTVTAGTYEFTDLCPGTYSITITSTKSTSGSINSTDAAQLNYWYAFANSGNPIPIEKVRFYGGDVVLNNYLDAGDAARILQYFVQAGNPGWTERAKWTFWPCSDPAISYNMSSPPSGMQYPAFTVNPSFTANPVTMNFWGLATGDFNRSFIPAAGSAKAGNSNITLLNVQTLNVNAGIVFELPVYAAMDMNVGAISMIMNFPADQLEITGVYLKNNPSVPLQYNVSGNELRIGWNSLQPISLLNGQRLLTLLVKAKAPAGDNNISFKMVANLLNELANENYNLINNALISMDNLSINALNITNNFADKFAFSNHPNPFKEFTTFDYTLPYDGKVSLEIYDIIGKKITLIIDETQTAGSHTFTLDTKVFKAGFYTCTLKLENNNKVIYRTIKIVRD
ncbi:MAG: T9SS type A sorting domain-containing protein, partial [Bacteroidetes bacterium]|nr:T9SS type A sorting domain-containing protein [Bacteroidota bacterium]